MTQQTGSPAGSTAYCVVTCARNEAAYIEHTIQSVISQSVLPARWFIVNDASTDRTEEIVQSYAKDHAWIELRSAHRAGERHFASKAWNFNAALIDVARTDCDFIVNLDADVAFGDDYFEFVLGQFAGRPRLGIAGTPYTEDGRAPTEHVFADQHFVSGQCQVFRRRCLEEIGGYAPVGGGGEDTIAVTMAQMHRWETAVFRERTYRHLRTMGSAAGTRLLVGFRAGRRDFALGNHPLWQILRSLFGMREKPWVVAGALLFIGYSWEGIRTRSRPVSREFVAFRRQGQLRRLKGIVRSLTFRKQP